MEGLILLFLAVVVMVFVVPAVALAKASRASRAIEELKQRLLMLEARPAESRDAAWRAWARLPPTHAYQRGVTATVLLSTSQALGEGARAVAWLEASLDDPTGTSPYSGARVRSSIGAVKHSPSGKL